MYNEKCIDNIFSPHTISFIFPMCLSHSYMLTGGSLLALAYPGRAYIACVEQNPPNEEATEIAQSRADLFGLKVVTTKQLNSFHN